MLLPYQEFLLCREMGWTYEELERQPAHRIEEALAFLAEEAAAQRALEKAAGR
ncbi:MAG: hypothetical protein QJR03_14990 [Sphaerobacter sp.]|nr:hypothetical protein [Sphaerobacter sp.]